MSEMEYEPLPEVYVPVVRDWFSPAFDAWTRFMYPPGRRFFVVGCLFIILLGWWILLKLAIWASVVAILLAAFILTIPWDLATYKHRRQLAYEAALRPYAEEVFQNPRDEEYPDEVAG